MRDIMKDAYDKCPIGGMKIVTPDPSLSDSLGGFQSVLMAAKVMQEQGLVFVKEVHYESQSGKKLIDAITIVRVK